ncbi:MAG: DHHA1 domain-containing protein [Candidatus Omnitrophota bacterium]
MELIVAHANADFDALASVVAAKKLYPSAKAVLPGSAEKPVRDFLKMWQDEIGVDKEKDIDFSKVDKLILVETRSWQRIGTAASILKRKDLEIEIYDHHPKTRYDIKAGKDFYKKTGATVSILLEIIKKKNIEITPLEATIMALGIYEDTGSLTFQTTTKLDIDNVGYLFSRGASLNIVTNYLRRELSSKQIKFLSLLIKQTRDYIINGMHIGVVAVEIPKYVEDIALLVHKLLDVENFNIIFAFLRVTEDGKIYMVARSRLAFIDVGKIAKLFGGGGHAYASSANIKVLGLNECVNKLLLFLKSKLKPRMYAEDIVSPTIKAVTQNYTVIETRRLMQKFSLDAVAVLDDGSVKGVVKKADVEKGVKRGESDSSIMGCVKTSFARIGAHTPLYKIKQELSKDRLGILAVFKNKKFLGLISCIDISKILHNEMFEKEVILKPRRVVHQPIKNIASKMKKNMLPDIYKLVKLIGALADEKGFKVFCVGGFVRDILLGVKNFDVDIVLEEKGLQFAKTLSDRLKGALVVHRRFQTATVVFRPSIFNISKLDVCKDIKFKVDVATARKEYYEYPAALPTVIFSSIKQDLYRRDFSVNAMAVSLNKGSFGRLVDFYNGQKDLRAKKIRILHDLSFVEDPTRIFRAVRFEQRYNFAIEPHTENLIKTAVNLDMFGRTQKQRLRDEIILILSEPKPVKALVRMHELHELRFIHEKLKFNKHLLKMFDSIEQSCSWFELSFIDKRPIDKWLIFFAAIVYDLSLGQLKMLCEEFIFRKGDEKRLLLCKKETKKISKILQSKRSVLPSTIFKYLEGLPYEVILFIMAKTDFQVAKERISCFLREHHGVKLSITGKDLKSLGISPGPNYKKFLDYILSQKIDGKIKTRDDEMKLAVIVSKTKQSKSLRRL